MTVRYQHTICGRPAYFDENTQRIMFVNTRGKAKPLAYSLQQIREEQRADRKGDDSSDFDYVRVDTEAIPTHRMSAQDICFMMPALKQRLFQLELWKTGHSLDETTNKLGWEIADQLAKEIFPK